MTVSDLQMGKILISSLKEYNSCLGAILQTLNYADCHYDSKSNNFIKQIVLQCKDPNAPDRNGDTGMHLAAKFRSVKIAKMLMELSPDVLAKNKKGQTPLDFAEENLNFRLIDLLLSDQKYKKDVGIATEVGNLPILKTFYLQSLK